MHSTIAIVETIEMDSLDLLEVFQEVVRRRSFSAAARALGRSPGTISKAVARLEQRFGVRLLNRTTRQVSLTDAGQILLERSAHLLELVDMTRGELQALATRPSGLLRLTAPHSLMQTALPVMLGQFLQEYPEVRIDLHATDRVVDLAEEGMDLAFRAGPIPDAELIVKRLLPVNFVAVATPAYWQAQGQPTHPRDLAGHRQLAHRLPGRAPIWLFSVADKPFELALKPVFSSTDRGALIQLALQGAGVIWETRQALLGPLREGRLQACLQDYSPRDFWVYAAYMARRHNSAALRALLDHLGGLYQADGSLQGEHESVS